MTWLYRVFHSAAIPLTLRLWTRLCVQGEEHLPSAGPFILISNHVDNWDTYVLGLFVKGRVINYLARPEGVKSRWLGWYWRQLGAIPADREGLPEALRILKSGGAVGIFPEGVIAPSLLQAMPGSALLALRSGAPVIPAAIWGTEQIRPWSILNRPRVTVRYGPPLLLTRSRGRDSRAAVDTIMRAVATMLPRRYRGVYAGADSA